MKKLKSPNTIRRVKKVPKFWWDYEGDNQVVVESDCGKYPIVGRFYHTGDALLAIAAAERLIADLNAVGKKPQPT